MLLNYLTITRQAETRDHGSTVCAKFARHVALLGAALVAVSACTRSQYRQWSDDEVYKILNERMTDPRWTVPARPVEPDESSRMALVAPQDKGPLPPDDPAAHHYMHHAGRHKGFQRWHARGDLESIESTAWLDGLQRDAEGNFVIGRQNAVQVALMNSRAYQSGVEDIYLTALGLTLERFDFDTRWFAGTGVDFRHFGISSRPTESNTLAVDSRFGLRRNFTAGGQLLVEVANSLVWEFTGDDMHMASSGIVVSLTQPLLRGAFRQVRMEGLTQSERDVLYSVRDFARFRRQFYVDTQVNFLDLLLQVQGLRNGRSNLVSLERNLLEHEELAIAGMVTPIQVDQVFQRYQSTQLGLLNLETRLETSLDSYKVQLGLPPQLPARLDETLLASFELDDPRLGALMERNDAFYLSFLQTDDPPPRDRLADGYRALAVQQAELAGILAEVRAELSRWQQRLEETRPPAEPLPAPAGPPPTIDAAAQEHARQQRLASGLQTVLDEAVELLAEDARNTEAALVRLPTEDLGVAWEALLQLIGGRFRERAADIFVAQAQVRVYLIEVTPVDLSEEQATALALENRLDLMNGRGTLVDAWRRVEVAADRLQGGLDVRAEADLNTDPAKNNPIRFDASAHTYELGLAFDTPLDRLAERNVYRASQIAYQRARRSYMALEDDIRSAIRRDLRNLRATRLGFEIARQQLVTAARQVDEAQVSLRTAQQADSSVTQDLLIALQSLLNAQNSMIGTWVNYEIARMNLFFDMDTMEIDAEGNWTNERNDPTASHADFEEVLGIPAEHSPTAPVLEPLPPLD